MVIKWSDTNTDYQAALKEIERLMMAESDTENGEKLDVVAALIHAYKAKHF